ncbi:unnamed protein product [Ascophyllum nodosum]
MWEMENPNPAGFLLRCKQRVGGGDHQEFECTVLQVQALTQLRLELFRVQLLYKYVYSKHLHY